MQVPTLLTTHTNPGWARTSCGPTTGWTELSPLTTAGRSRLLASEGCATRTRSGGSLKAECAMRPPTIVVRHVLEQHRSQVLLIDKIT